eukprot:787824_1
MSDSNHNKKRKRNVLDPISQNHNPPNKQQRTNENDDDPSVLWNKRYTQFLRHLPLTGTTEEQQTVIKGVGLDPLKKYERQSYESENRKIKKVKPYVKPKKSKTYEDNLKRILNAYRIGWEGAVLLSLFQMKYDCWVLRKLEHADSVAIWNRAAPRTQAVTPNPGQFDEPPPDFILGTVLPFALSIANGQDNREIQQMKRQITLLKQENAKLKEDIGNPSQVIARRRSHRSSVYDIPVSLSNDYEQITVKQGMVKMGQFALFEDDRGVTMAQIEYISRRGNVKIHYNDTKTVLDDFDTMVMAHGDVVQVKLDDNQGIETYEVHTIRTNGVLMKRIESNNDDPVDVPIAEDEDLVKFCEKYKTVSTKRRAVESNKQIKHS